MAEYPRIDGRSYPELVSQTETLVKLVTSTVAPVVEELEGRVLDETIATASQVYRAGTVMGPQEAQAVATTLAGTRRVQVRPWRPDPTQPDPAWTLVRLFGRMLGQVTSRLDQVPQKHRLAFLNLVGVTRRPPRAARAPLTFVGSEATTANANKVVVVPAGTQVAAPAQDGLPEATFETETELTLTQAQLTHAFSRQPTSDTFNDRSLAIQDGTGFPAFSGELPMDHSLFVRCDSLWGLPGRQWLGLTFTGLTADIQKLTALPLVLSYTDGQRWLPLYQSPSWKRWNGAAWVPWEGFPAISSGMQVQLASDGGNSGLTSSQVKITAGLAVDAQGRQLGTPDTVLELSAFTDPIVLVFIRWKSSSSTNTSSEIKVVAESARLASPDSYPEGEWLQLARLLLTRTTAVTVSRAMTGNTASVGSGMSTWQLQVQLPPVVAPSLLPGVPAAACWLKLQLTGQLSQTQEDPPGLPEALTIKARVQTSRSGLSLEQGLFNGAILDLSRDFRPLGERPTFNDVFYLRNNEAFSRPGMSVVLTAVNSDYLTGKDWKDVSPTLAWEAWNGSTWVELGRSDKNSTYNSSTSYSFKDETRAFTVSNKEITLTLPSTTGRVTVQGVSGYWIRVRLIAGNYGAEMTAVPSSDGKSLTWVAKTLEPPSLKSLALRYTLNAETGLDGCVRQENLTPQDCTGLSTSASLTPFVRGSERLPAFYLGFDRAFERRAITLFLEVQSPLPLDARPTEVESNPPPDPVVTWEYSGSNGWTKILAEDGTQGLSCSGMVRFIGLADPVARTELGQERYWLRATWKATSTQVIPRVGYVLPNTLWASHRVAKAEELLGASDSTPDQTFTVSQTPILMGERLEVREPELPSASELLPLEIALGINPVTTVEDPPGSLPHYWIQWQPVSDFYGSGPRDRHYMLDHFTGQVTFGNGRNGMIPPAFQDSSTTDSDGQDARIVSGNIRLRGYASGGGANGNRAAGTITQLKSSLTGIKGVTNRLPSGGGADGESTGALETRGARSIRHGGRAVSVQDFEDLALEASTLVARAKAIPPSFDASEQNDEPQADKVLGAGTVLVVIVPRSDEPRPVPGQELIRSVQNYLAARATPSAALRVSGPEWAEVQVNVTLSPVDVSDGERVLTQTRAVIDAFLHPLTGGREGTGWEFGRRPHPSDLYPLIAGVEGVDHVDSLTIICNDMPSDETTLSRSQLRSLSWHLIYSGNHTLNLVTAGEENPS